MAKDKARKIIKVGDLFVTPRVYADSPSLFYGKVVGVSAKGIRVVCVNDWYSVELQKPGTVKKSTNLLVLPRELVAQHALKLLDKVKTDGN